MFKLTLLAGGHAVMFKPPAVTPAVTPGGHAVMFKLTLFSSSCSASAAC
jgi:hypothetical protein